MSHSTGTGLILKSYRIIHNRYVKTAFDGEGARIYGGRWNSRGTSVIYTSESLSLATLEILVHLEDAAVLTENFSYFETEFPDNIVQTIDLNLVPKDWYRNPPGDVTQRIGDDWIRDSSSAVLKVPSSVILEEFNYLFNPNHKDFKKIETGRAVKLRIDERLVDRL